MALTARLPNVWTVPIHGGQPALYRGYAADVTSEESIDAVGATQEGPAKRRRWHQRPTIRTLKRRAIEERGFSESWDRRDNDATRLPATEAVHLGAFVLTEAFTPSSVSGLYKALEELPIDRPDLKQEWLTELTRSRRGRSGGWRNLGHVRRPGSIIMGDGFTDAALPESIEAVWLHLSYTGSTPPSVDSGLAVLRSGESAT